MPPAQPLSRIVLWSVCDPVAELWRDAVSIGVIWKMCARSTQVVGAFRHRISVHCGRSHSDNGRTCGG